MVQVVWFKRDLRTQDHAPLVLAAAAGPVIPLYVVEPDYWRGDDVSRRQWLFIRATLEGLASDLARLGAPLIICVGDVVEVLAGLHRRHAIMRCARMRRRAISGPTGGTGPWPVSAVTQGSRGIRNASSASGAGL